MFSSEVRGEWGGCQGGKSWLENCVGDSVGCFWLGIIVYSGQSDTRVS